MEAVLIGRLKKWIFFAFIGCTAYFVGYAWGIKNQTPTERTPATYVQEPPPAPGSK